MNSGSGSLKDRSSDKRLGDISGQSDVHTCAAAGSGQDADQPWPGSDITVTESCLRLTEINTSRKGGADRRSFFRRVLKEVWSLNGFGSLGGRRWRGQIPRFRTQGESQKASRAVVQG